MVKKIRDFIGARFFIFSLLSACLILYVVGVVSPLVTFKNFFIFSDTISLISGIYKLFINQYWTLSIILFLFSLLFPFLKILLTYILLHDLSKGRPKNKRIYNLMLLCEKWSMLDVFIVALLILNIKLNFITRVTIEYGFYAFAASVLLLMVVTTILKRDFQD